MTTTNTTESTQSAAETFWSIATSSDVNIARYDGPAYIAAERALIKAIRVERGVSLKVA